MKMGRGVKYSEELLYEDVTTDLNITVENMTEWDLSGCQD